MTMLWIIVGRISITELRWSSDWQLTLYLLLLWAGDSASLIRCQLLVKRQIVFYFFQNYISFFVGGTLGLFTGISILSIMEVVFWILRYFIKNAVGRKAFKMHKKWILDHDHENDISIRLSFILIRFIFILSCLLVSMCIRI